MAEAALDLDSATTEQLVDAAWRLGQLSWKLRPHQLRVYRDYREWEAAPTRSDAEGALDLMFALRIARRWGKTFLVCLIMVEDCLRHPGSRRTYATAYAKDIGNIVAPIIDDITDDCPKDIAPRYQGTSEAEAGGYYFANGSVLKLVGIDEKPKKLRGQGSDGFAVTEAGFVKNLDKTIREVIYPQFQQRPRARMILESSHPEDPNHDFLTLFEEAKTRNAYADKTIDDNEALDPIEKARFVRASGPAARREYYNETVRSDTRTVVPEFDEKVHVQSVPVPAFADCFVSIDPGVRDLCAILWGFADFENDRLVVQRDWAQRNTGIATIASVLLSTEAELWGGLKRWDGRVAKDNPYLRVSDTNALMLQELARVHGIRISPADKRVGAQRELSSNANVQSLRAAIGRGQVIIDPACVELIAHLNSAIWNEQRSDYQRSERFGHFDLLDALVYLWRAYSARRLRNPAPPKHAGAERHEMFVPEHVAQPVGHTAKAFDELFGSRAPTWTPGKKWERPRAAPSPIRRSSRR